MHGQNLRELGSGGRCDRESGFRARRVYSIGIFCPAGRPTHYKTFALLLALSLAVSLCNCLNPPSLSHLSHLLTIPWSFSPVCSLYPSIPSQTLCPWTPRPPSTPITGQVVDRTSLKIFSAACRWPAHRPPVVGHPTSPCFCHRVCGQWLGRHIFPLASPRPIHSLLAAPFVTTV